jgi:hypothetical protein
MSSIGSDGGGSDSEKTSPRHVREYSSSASGNFFVEMFAAASPRNSAGSNVSDFHRGNQDFLKQQHHRPVTQEQQTVHRRVGSEDRPPASRGTHKRLASINDDDWNDSGEEGQGAAGAAAAGPIHRTGSSGGEASSISGYSSRYILSTRSLCMLCVHVCFAH